MAKPAKKVEMVWVTPLGRKRLDPYNGVWVSLGEKYQLDEKKAEMLAAMGEVEILEEEVSEVKPPVENKDEKAKAQPVKAPQA